MQKFRLLRLPISENSCALSLYSYHSPHPGLAMFCEMDLLTAPHPALIVDAVSQKDSSKDYSRLAPGDTQSFSGKSTFQASVSPASSAKLLRVGFAQGCASKA